MKLNKTTMTQMDRLKFWSIKEPQVRSNPYTGKEHLLPAEACNLYDFITTSRYCCGKDYTRGQWDNARYYFQSKWPNEYMDLLD